MITIVTEGAVDPKFLTATDIQDMRDDIPVKDAQIDALMEELAGKMGIDEKVPYENIDDVVQANAATNTPGIVNVESIADSNSQQGVPSVWIVKKLLAQTKASPSVKINGKPLTSNVTYTAADFNIYTAAEIRAKFATPPTPAVAMKLGTLVKAPAAAAEKGAGHVLVDVEYDSTWSGYYRPLIAVLQDGTELVVPFS